MKDASTPVWDTRAHSTPTQQDLHDISFVRFTLLFGYLQYFNNFYASLYWVAYVHAWLLKSINIKMAILSVAEETKART